MLLASEVSRDVSAVLAEQATFLVPVAAAHQKPVFAMEETFVDVLDFALNRLVKQVDQGNFWMLVLWSLLVLVLPICLVVGVATLASWWCAKSTGSSLGWMLMPVLLGIIAASGTQAIFGHSELCFTHAEQLPPSMERLATANLPWWTPRMSPEAKERWPAHLGSRDVIVTQGALAEAVLQGDSTESGYSPMDRSYVGVGRVWLARNMIPSALLANWTLGAISTSDAGAIMVDTDISAYEQDSTEQAHGLLADIVSDDGVNFSNLLLGPANSDTPRGKVSAKQAEKAYLSENAHMLMDSAWLSSNADTIETHFLRAWTGRHVDSTGAPARLPIVMSTKFLWISAAGSSSGAHADVDPANFLVQLNGTKDLWIYRPDHDRWLGRMSKWDTSATLAAISGFEVWDAPDASSPASSFEAGDECSQMNRVAFLQQGSVDAAERSQFKDCTVTSQARAVLEASQPDWNAAAEEAVAPSMPPPDASQGAIHIRLFPGDALSIPTGWVHMARSRSEGVSLSIRPLSLCQGIASIRLLAANLMHSLGLLKHGDCTCHEAKTV